MQMERNILSYTFVGILEKPISIFPAIQDDFLISLFDLPYETLIRKDTSGIAVQVRNRYVGAALSSDKIVITAETPEQLSDIQEKFITELRKTLPEHSVTAYGINYEIEYVKLGLTNSKWLWNKFMSGLSVGDIFHECNKIDFKLGIASNQYFNFIFEPRANNPYAVFLSLNHHHQCYPVVSIFDIDVKQKITESMALYDIYEKKTISI